MVKFFSASALVLVAMVFMTACSDVPTTPTNDGGASRDGEITAKPGGGGGSANPVFVYRGSRTVKARTVATIQVCDNDGSDNSYVYTSATSGTDTWYPTWSPNGGSVSFVKMPDVVTGDSWYQSAAWGAYAVRVVDVAVTNGVVSGSNTRTVFTTSTADSMRINSQAWCPSTTGSGAGKIAFMALGSTVSRIYLIPAAGGPATIIYEVQNTTNHIRGGSLTWSLDGEKLAFTQYSGSLTANADRTFEIEIIDLNGAVVTTLLPGSTNIAQCRWSTTDIGTLVCVMSPSSVFSDNLYGIYKISTAAGSTAEHLAAIDLNGGAPTWSPNGTEIIYKSTDASVYRINVATHATTVYAVGHRFEDWK
jgi:hypothetical protein